MTRGRQRGQEEVGLRASLWLGSVDGDGGNQSGRQETRKKQDDARSPSASTAEEDGRP